MGSGGLSVTESALVVQAGSAPRVCQTGHTEGLVADTATAFRMQAACWRRGLKTKYRSRRMENRVHGSYSGRRAVNSQASPKSV